MHKNNNAMRLQHYPLLILVLKNIIIDHFSPLKAKEEEPNPGKTEKRAGVGSADETNYHSYNYNYNT